MHEYGDSDDEGERGGRRRLSKNQQIYGDFYEAYEPDPTPLDPIRTNTYNQFKAGATIETYSSEVEVDLPKQKPRFQKAQEEEEKPMLGKFSLDTFLNQMGGMGDIEEEDEQSVLTEPEGLNDKIMEYLQLVPAGEEIQERPKDLAQMNYQEFLRASKPQPKVEPKYKTQEEKELAKEFHDGYGVGFKMLEKMGFKVNKGLGKDLTGIHRPVEAVFKTAFTMKDEEPGQQEQSKNIQKEEDTRTPAERLFQLRSRRRDVNDFLIDLKNSYQKLQSQIYFYSREIESFKKEEELNDSLRLQRQNEAQQLRQEIKQLEKLQSSPEQAQLQPHLALHYKLDLLCVKQLHEKIRNNSWEWLLANANIELRSLTSRLADLYLARTRQTMRDYSRSNGMEGRFANHSRTRASEDIATTTPEDEERMAQLVELVLSKGVAPQVEAVLGRAGSIDKVADLRVIELLETVKKMDRKGTVFKRLIKEKIQPLVSNYLQTVNLQELEQEGNRKLPHLVLFPWLTVLPPTELGLLSFYRRLAGRLWNIESGAFYSIIAPLMKFSSPKEVNFLSNLCIAPRLLNELQRFRISEPNSELLNGLTKYSEFLEREARMEILENTVAVQIRAAYQQYKSELGEKELLKWLKKWRKFTDKIVSGYLAGEYPELSISVE